jgi:hypothetical protein
MHRLDLAADSLVEGDGFERSVPLQSAAYFETVPDTATANRLGSQNRF